MKYTIDKQEKYCLLRLDEDRLNSVLAPALKAEFITLSAEGIKNLILDLSEVKYTDSSGLSALLVGNRVFKENNGSLIMTNLSEHAMKLMKISQLDNVFNIWPTVDEAIQDIFMTALEDDLKNK